MTILQHEGFRAEISSHGAELQSFKNPQGREYIWNGNPEYWNRRSPVLFPIVGSLKDGKYQYQGKEYRLPRHGFARDQEFSLTHSSDNQAVFSLHYNQESLKDYPFQFWLQINYRLLKNTLLIGYSVINDGQNKMAFTLGAHPAFNLEGNFSDYTLEFPKSEALQTFPLENGLLSRQKNVIPLKKDGALDLEYSTFENDALVIKNNPGREVVIRDKSEKILSVEFDDFPHLGIWTVQDAPFICIEPWYGYSDSVDSSGVLFEKEGMLYLEPGAVFNTNFAIRLF